MEKQKRHFTLSQILILFFLMLLFVPVVFIILYWYMHIVHTTQNRLYTEMDTISDIVTREYQNKVDEMYVIADIISANPTLIGYLSQKDTSFNYQNYLTTFREIGPYLESIRQTNNNIETIRIWALNDKTQRYQNSIFPFSALKNTKLYQILPQISYGKYRMMPSANLFSYQNSDNRYELCYPINVTSDVLTFSMFTWVYSQISHQPIAFLECVMQTDTLLDVSYMNLDIEQIYILEENNGVIYAYNDQDNIKSDLSKINLSDNLYDQEMQIGSQSYHIFTYHIPEPDVTLVIATPSISLYQQSRMEFFLLMIILLLFLLLFCCLLYWTYRNFFVRLELLNNRMNQLRSGDDNVTFDDMQNDEIGQINRTLSLLIDKIYHVKLAENEAICSYLRAQIEPHFLFNALEAIRMTAMLGDTEKVSNALMSLGALMRIRIEHYSQSTVSEEISLVQSYVQLENIRFDGRIHLQIQVDPGLNSTQIPSLMLQPLVENTVKHGMPTGNLPLNVKINITELPDDRLLIRILDNGTGIAPKRLEQIEKSLRECKKTTGEPHGVALVNIVQRLHLYYENRAQLTLFSDYGTGTQVTVTLPRSVS